MLIKIIHISNRNTERIIFLDRDTPFLKEDFCEEEATVESVTFFEGNPPAGFPLGSVFVRE